MIERILVAMDGSEQAEKALQCAIENHPDATITVLHAYGLSGLDGTEGTMDVHSEKALEIAQANAEDIFRRARGVAERLGYGSEIETVEMVGDPRQAIPEYADEFDAVFIGTYGRKGTYQVLLGSVAEAVVHRATVPVMVVK